MNLDKYFQWMGNPFGLWDMVFKNDRTPYNVMFAMFATFLISQSILTWAALELLWWGFK